MADDSHVAAMAAGRASAPAANPEEIKERNRKALEARKAKLTQMQDAEKKKALPAGWRMVESRSRPGDFVYENIHTEERQAWFPDAPAPEEASTPLVPMSADDQKKAELKEKNRVALEKRRQSMNAQKTADKDVPLPEGWKRVESRSRPGEMVYENLVTGERQAWFPDAPAIAGPVDPKKKDLMDKNKAALEKRKASMTSKKSEDSSKPLPQGWKRVESRSRPGEFVYENEFTEERQAWFPDGPAEKPLPPGWRKVESRTYPGEYVYENVHTLDRQAWLPTAAAPLTEQAGPPPGAPAAAAVKTARPIVAKCKALYDYTAVNREEEIDLVEGDVILVEYKAANGWFVGLNSRTSRNGIFPGTYVEDIK